MHLEKGFVESAASTILSSIPADPERTVELLRVTLKHSRALFSHSNTLRSYHSACSERKHLFAVHIRPFPSTCSVHVFVEALVFLLGGGGSL